MEGKEVSAERVRKVTSINGSNVNDFHLVALADSKNDSMKLTNWPTTIRNRNAKERRSG